MQKQLFIFLICTLLLSLSAAAHPGRTDSNGGHTDRSTGEYHYHHGYPKHQHTGGICPYAFDDKTGQNSNNGSTYESDSSKILFSVTDIANTTDLGIVQNTKGDSMMPWNSLPYLFAIGIAILAFFNFTTDTDITPSRPEKTLNLINGIISVVSAVTIVSLIDNKLLGICIVAYILSRFIRHSRTDAELYDRIDKLEKDLAYTKDNSRKDLDRTKNELDQAKADAKFYRSLLK